MCCQFVRVSIISNITADLHNLEEVAAIKVIIKCISNFDRERIRIFMLCQLLRNHSYEMTHTI